MPELQKRVKNGWKRLLKTAFGRAFSQGKETAVSFSAAGVGVSSQSREDTSTPSAVGLPYQPPELMDIIFDNLVTDDPSSTSRDLASMRLTNRAVRAYINGDQLLRRVQLPLEVTRLASEIFETTYSKLGLLNFDTPPDLHGHNRRLGRPVSVGSRMAAVAPILHFLSEDRRAAVVDDVRRLYQPGGQAEAVLALAKYSDFRSLAKPDRDFLIAEATRGFGTAGQIRSKSRLACAEALASVHDQLEPEQRFEIEQKWSGRPRLKEIFDEKLRGVPRPVTEGTTSGARAGNFSRDLQRIQQDFREASQVHRVSRILKRRGVEYDRVEKMASVARSLSDAVGDDYSNARTELERRRQIRGRERGRNRGL